ncbi:NADP-dependent oxidoreductase [Planosporangium sp. 12N6]|uniref:NADP-dependent oxidoreductase n=1 Tax=Planosporangium spinosum TaxID=3402278 RepID=UPI003CFB9F6D
MTGADTPTATTSREIHLAARPEGWPTAGNFRLVAVPVPEPGPGQVVVRNLVMSVDPYMRGRMNAGESYVPPFRVGEALDGGAVGEVVASASPDLAVGDTVLHGLGWREYALLDAAKARKVDTADVPPSAYLGALGMVGLTAYVGLLDIAAMRPSDTVFVSGAAGAVGSIAGQIAKLRGSPRVIGSAGSAAKVEYLTGTLGFDAAFNYRDAPVADQLRAAAPDGIDAYFDNVGGDHLEAAISVLNPHGRVALCGAISQYNAPEPEPGPRNLFLAVGRRLTLRGFIVGDHADRMPDFLAEAGRWLREGRLRVDETVVEGIENAPDAFLGMLRGANRGKMLVRLT